MIVFMFNVTSRAFLMILVSSVLHLAPKHFSIHALVCTKQMKCTFKMLVKQATVLYIHNKLSVILFCDFCTCFPLSSTSDSTLACSSLYYQI